MTKDDLEKYKKDLCRIGFEEFCTLILRFGYYVGIYYSPVEKREFVYPAFCNPELGETSFCYNTSSFDKENDIGLYKVVEIDPSERVVWMEFVE